MFSSCGGHKGLRLIFCQKLILNVGMKAFWYKQFIMLYVFFVGTYKIFKKD